MKRSCIKSRIFWVGAKPKVLQSKSSKKDVLGCELWRFKDVKTLIYLSGGVWTAGLELVGCRADAIWTAGVHHRTFPSDT